MRSSLLERRDFFAQNALTQSQLSIDAAVNNFSSQAADPSSLAAMTIGSFAFRLARLGFLQGAASTGLSRIAPRFLTQGAAHLFALSTEVTAFRGANHFFASLSGHFPEQSIFDSKGWKGTFTDFLALKSIGHLGAGQNIFLTHFAQANAMVLGHQISADLGFTQHEEGSYIERLAQAEATNIALSAGMGLLHRFAPGLSRLERGLELRNTALIESPAVRATGRSPLLRMSSVENPPPVRVQSEGTRSVPGGTFDMWGERLFNASKSSWAKPDTWRNPFRILQDRILNEMLRDEATKKRMIAFLDVVTNAPNRTVVDLLRAYFPRGGQNSQGLLRLALNLGVSPWIPAFLKIWGIRLGLQGMARRFLAGEDSEAALAQARHWRAHGVQATLDVVQENVVSVREADHYTETVVKLIREWRRETDMAPRTAAGIPVRHISVKLSGLTQRFDPLAHDWVMQDVGKRLLQIFKEAKESADRGAPVMVNVDLEDYAVRDLSYDIFWNTLNHSELAGWQDAAVVVQAYYKESAHSLQKLLEKAEEHHKRIQIRLVKGAYHSYEQIRAARNGWEVPVFLTQAETDQNFRRLADMALQKHPAIHLAIGSHNLEDMAYVQARREEMNIPIHEVEHQFLRGVGNHLARAAVQLGIPARFYGPFGSKANGLGYMVRRLDEVKINSAIGETHSAGTWADYRARRQRVNPPATNSANTGFVNAAESDFSKSRVRSAMAEAIERLKSRFPLAVTPLIASEQTYHRHRREAQVNVNPGNWRENVSEIWEARPEDISQAIEAAQRGHQTWSSCSQAERSAILNRAADLVHERQYEIAAYLVTEAGKPWHLALGEVNEGIDFLRSYALDALEVSKQREALGVGVAIAPFNFPFAIALGEMAGGLALGNAMILKPSEQTPAVGKLLVEILREAGVPPEAVQFLPGKKNVGENLVASPQVDFVVFTGSLGAAMDITENARLHPSERHGYKIVVAETGGKNAMIIDKTADLDVAVKAVLDGAFLMSGQRCSATSRVFVDEKIADDFMARLVQGAQSMIVGDPTHPETQVGPQIDHAAYDKVMRYLTLGAQWGSSYPPTFTAFQAGHYIGPWIFEGDHPQAPFAQQEIFGPALAVMRVRNMQEAVRLANDSPYGLTAGLISRDPRNIQYFFENIQAGNSYVNRSQVGAMVRRQPFGGLLDSGTGPKAGGQHYYVARFGRPKKAPYFQTSEDLLTHTPEESNLLSPLFDSTEKSWDEVKTETRLQFAETLIYQLRHPSGPLATLKSEQREKIIHRIQKYIHEARKLLIPQITLATAGEINEEAHDWPQGKGLLWDEAEKTEDFISNAVAASLMGNTLVIAAGSPKAVLTQHLFRQAAQAMNLPTPIYTTSLPLPEILNDTNLDFIVANGAFASNVFRHFKARLRARVGFRRTIGGHMDHPEDALYLTRFAAARTRSEETLRHGAELNLR